MKKLHKIYFIFLLILFTSFSDAQEICNNGIDDDADGLVDLNDPECACNTANVSLVANHSFENNTGCPSTYQQFNLASNWVSGNSEVVDYINTCGFTRFNGVPFPDGNGVAGCFYLEDRLRYIGQCLPIPLTSSTNYTLNFEVSALSINNAGNLLDVMVGGLCPFNYNSMPYPVTIVLYGTSNCADLPWAGTGNPVGSGSWVVLGQVVYNPADTLWNDVSINFTPSTNIAAIAIGPPAVQNTQFPIYNENGNGNIGCFPFIQYDNLILNQANLVTNVDISRSGGFCTNDLVFTGQCNISGGTWQWYKNGIALAGETNALLQVSANNNGVGNYTVKYTLGGNCYTEDYLLQLPNGITTDFITASSCMENIVAFTNLSFGASQPIVSWNWDFGDGDTSTTQNPVHRYSANGNYTVKLVITTNQGCKDSISKLQVVNKPTPLILGNCSCSGLGVSLIPNHSFEDHSCCPTDYSQLNCADTWIQASQGTSDYYNTCGFTGGNMPLVTPAPLPPPDGNGFAGYADSNGGYKEYIGACLVEPMIAGSTYNLTLQMAGESNTNVAFWGATSCNDLPFPGSPCPQGIGSWQILNQQTVTLGGGIWHTVTMSLTLTQDIYAVLIGPDCGENGFAYNYVDDLKLSSSILQPIVGLGSYCSNNTVLKSGSANGTFELEYQWFKNGIELIGETDTLLNVSANGYGSGDYQIMGIFREGCDISPIFHVDTFSVPQAKFISDTVCLGTNTLFTDQSTISSDSITSWLWDFGDATPTSPMQNPTHLYASGGTFNVTLILESDHGCRDTTMANVIVYSLPSADAGPDQTICSSTLLLVGSIAGTATSGTWSGGTGTFNPNNTTLTANYNPSAAEITAGTVTLTLTTDDPIGPCPAATDQMVITINPLVVVSAGPDQTICIGNTATLAGVASGSATSGTWTGGTGTYNPNNTSPNAVYTPSLAEATAGTATLTYTTNDPAGPCPALNDQMLITINQLPTANAGSAQYVCSGSTIPLAGSVGGSATTGTWSGGTGTYSPNNTTLNAIYTPSAAEYAADSVKLTLTTNDPAGPCTFSLSNVTFYFYKNPVVNFTVNDPAGCPIHCVDFTDNSSVGGGDNLITWAWNFGDGITGNQQNPSHCYSQTGFYDVTLTATSNHGCAASLTIPQMIQVYALPVAEFNPTPNPATVLDPSITMYNLSSPDVNYWNWSFGDGTTLAPNTANPIHVYPNEVSSSYIVTLIVHNANDCYDTVSHEIFIGPEFTFFIPNAFSPNEDGVNDYFFGSGIGIVEYDLWIFDRWGDMIFHGTDLNDKWNGKANDGAEIAQQDVYVWKVRLTDVFSKKHHYIGTVTIVK